CAAMASDAGVRGHRAPSPMLLLSLLLSAAPFGLLGEETRQLLEFDGTNVSNMAAEPPGKPYPPYSLAEFFWNNITDSLDPATLSATFQGRPTHDPTRAFANGSLAFRVQAFSRSGRPAQPPRLLHTADTCQLEVALVGASPQGNRSLFGLEVATLGQGPDCPSIQEQHSIDDEYAPAIFQVRLPVERQMGGECRCDSIRTLQNGSTIYHLASPFKCGHCTNESDPVTALRGDRRQYSMSHALAGRDLQGLGALRRELSANLQGWKSTQCPPSPTLPSYRGKIKALPRTQDSSALSTLPVSTSDRWRLGEVGKGGLGTGWSSSLCLVCLSPQLDQLLWGSLPPGFVQWRPVAYSQKQGSRESALPCHASPLHPTLAYPLPQSPIVRAFFGPHNNFCAFNLTFGASTGPGYWDQHYLSW
uniref:Glycosylated lysosomal membrane protein n=1 Tax=Prolemur simus TaxID=1328070 RepID=A0A8C9DRV9_PROSS